jgi:poly(A) polymerase
VGPSFMIASLLWHDVQSRWQRLVSAGESTVPALQQAIDAVFDARIGDISGRGRLAADMREIWLMQSRFERRVGRSPYVLVEQPRYRASFDFLRLRADAGEVPGELADWWEDFALADEAEREALIAAARDEARVRRAAAPQAADAGPGQTAAPARKRRRRRRKPAAAAAESGSGSAATPASSADVS